MVLTKLFETGRVFVRAPANWDYNLEVATIANGGSTDWNVAAGTPVTNNAFTAAAAVNACTGITLTPVHVPAGKTVKCTVCVRGEDIVLDQNNLPTVDYVGAAITLNTFVTQLVALGFVVRAEGTLQEAQTS